MADDMDVNRLLCAYVRLVDQRGQTMAEYGILIGVIAVVVVVAAILFGSSISSLFSRSSTHL
jgi:Flp pilus assembly pilin Flp